MWGMVVWESDVRVVCWCIVECVDVMGGLWFIMLFFICVGALRVIFMFVIVVRCVGVL